MSRPLLELADAAAAFGRGGVLTTPDVSGVPEIDLLAATLADSSQQMNDSLTRERRFSADVSHQLRTPLASLRLRHRSGRPCDEPAHLAQATLDRSRPPRTDGRHLLSFARDAIPHTATCSVAQALDGAVARWAERAGRAQRDVLRRSPGRRPGQGRTDFGRPGRRGAHRQRDAPRLRHHRALASRVIAGGVAIDVSDDGTCRTDSSRASFRRRAGTDHGIGLALARSLAEAEGGRLLLARRQPTTFSLILLAADEEPFEPPDEDEASDGGSS